MNELKIDDSVIIENLIYEIRGVHVMLDSDLSRLYECTNGTKDVNKAVNRNIERFPKDFYFQLIKEEYDNLKFQNGTSSFSSYGGVRKLPYVFTEQDILKYNKQYHNLNIIYDNTYHDRYFILDNHTIYHCGASINRIGYKTFSITLISDKDVCEVLISKINTMI